MQGPQLCPAVPVRLVHRDSGAASMACFLYGASFSQVDLKVP